MEILIRNALDREGYCLNGTENNWLFAEKIVQSISGHNRIIIEGKAPTRVIAMENHNDEIEIYMNNGWQVNLKLGLSELSMINDIRLVGVSVM